MGDPYAEFSSILNFSREEISAGLSSSLIILLPTILMILLFRKAIKGNDEKSKNPSRFDKVVAEAAGQGKILLPDQSFTRLLRPGEKAEDGTRKVAGWPGYCYTMAWAVTVIFISK